MRPIRFRHAHPEPYPFTRDGPVPSSLARALAHQRDRFGGLAGSGPVMFVPLDFTRPDDGLPPADYGLDALLDALAEAVPRAVMSRIDALRADHGGKITARARSAILGYSVAAGAADALPIVAIAAVPAIQGAMLRDPGVRLFRRMDGFRYRVAAGRGRDRRVGSSGDRLRPEAGRQADPGVRPGRRRRRRVAVQFRLHLCAGLRGLRLPERAANRRGRQRPGYPGGLPHRSCQGVRDIQGQPRAAGMIDRGLLKEFRRELIAVALLVIPPLLLVPLGALWLIERGGTLAFLALGMACAVLAGLLMLYRRRKASAKPAEAQETPPDWPARERAAFEKVEAFARETPPLSFSNQGEAVDLARRTVDLVARHYRPDASTPMTTFTMPEALLSLESVARRLRRGLLLAVPLSDRLTVSQMVWLAGSWEKAGQFGEAAQRLCRSVSVRPAGHQSGRVSDGRSARIDPGGIADLREIRAEKPAHALADPGGRPGGGRTLLRPDAAGSGRTGANRRGGGTGGRCRGAGTARAAAAADRRTDQCRQIEPDQCTARSIVAQVTPLPGPAGFACFEAVDPAGDSCILVDAPGLSPAPNAIEALVAEASKADAVLWTVSAVQAARDADAKGLLAFRASFGRRADLNPPPVLCVVTHIDQLRPFTEWNPPYDVADPASPKARSIRQAMDAIAAELGMPIGRVVPVSVAPDREGYNLDVLRVCINGALAGGPSYPTFQNARGRASRRMVEGGRAVVSGGSDGDRGVRPVRAFP